MVRKAALLAAIVTVVATVILVPFAPDLIRYALIALLAGGIIAFVWASRSRLSRLPKPVGRLLYASLMVVAFLGLFVYLMLLPKYAAGPGEIYQAPYDALLVLGGSPEHWTVTETYGFDPPPPGTAPDPDDYPPGWQADERPVGDVLPVRKTYVLEPVPSTVLGIEHTSRVRLDPASIVAYPDLWIPANGSVVVIRAPEGAIARTYPPSGPPALKEPGVAETRVELSVGRFDGAPPPVVIETAPSWGRGPGISLLWTLSASTVVAALLSLGWAATGALLKDGLVALGKGSWRRLRPGNPPSPIATSSTPPPPPPPEAPPAPPAAPGAA